MIKLDGLGALTYGIIDAGVGVATGIVGYPVTRIVDNLKPIWISAANEKVGLDVALGASASGTRSVLVTKHVGLNVAADSLVTAATQGIGAGLLVIAGDDPGAKFSQNEQDSRWYGKLAEIPVMDPHGARNVYECSVQALELSEELSIPIIVRVTSRLLRAEGTIERANSPASPKNRVNRSIWDLTQLGMHQQLVKRKYPKMVEFAETTDLNEEVGTGVIGIVSTGYASAVVGDAIDGKHDVAQLRLGTVNPLCQRRIHTFLTKHDRVLVVEEGAPFVEESIRGRILGKMSGHLPRFGELSAEDISRALDYVEADYVATKFDVETLESRGYMRQICDNCPFLPFYKALSRLRIMVAGDLGCVIKAANPPLSLIDAAYSLGSAIGVASGFENSGVAIIGDFAFLHSGITALVNSAVFKRNVKVFVLENKMSAVTGGQPTPAVSDLIGAVCRNYGLNYQIVNAKDVNEESLARLLEATSRSSGTYVIVVRAPCPKYDESGCLDMSSSGT
ncbi:MAG TPA: thiamine pyrophosphate-dependent enzyme [Candidatus Acidoferrales bacterium]|nr:thiamine pyrophosphate-dependent enzyme [Candidatus Acidoferrales bacterium]